MAEHGLVQIFSGMKAQIALLAFSGIGGVARFTGGLPNLGADGTTRNQGQILHELGKLDAGFHPIGVGDTITVDAVAIVEHLTPHYTSDPTLSGRADLAMGSYLANLGMGARS